MNVYICYRYYELGNMLDRWMGAMIVAADSAEEAGRIVVDVEEEEDDNWYETIDEYRLSDAWPKRIVQMADVMATGKPRVLYEDYAR